MMAQKVCSLLTSPEKSQQEPGNGSSNTDSPTPTGNNTAVILQPRNGLSLPWEPQQPSLSGASSERPWPFPKEEDQKQVTPQRLAFNIAVQRGMFTPQGERVPKHIRDSEQLMEGEVWVHDLKNDVWYREKPGMEPKEVPSGEAKVKRILEEAIYQRELADQIRQCGHPAPGYKWEKFQNLWYQRKIEVGGEPKSGSCGATRTDTAKSSSLCLLAAPKPDERNKTRSLWLKTLFPVTKSDK
jgi:hypothetical protein